MFSIIMCPPPLLLCVCVLSMFILHDEGFHGSLPVSREELKGGGVNLHIERNEDGERKGERKGCIGRNVTMHMVLCVTSTCPCSNRHLSHTKQN